MRGKGKLNRLLLAFFLTIVAFSMASSVGSAVDLTGVWGCDDGGTYYLRQVGNTVWWYGEYSPIDPGWTNVAKGTISGSKLTVTWADVPKGGAGGAGSMDLSIASDDELRATAKRGSGFGGSVWTR